MQGHEMQVMFKGHDQYHVRLHIMRVSTCRDLFRVAFRGASALLPSSERTVANTRWHGVQSDVGNNLYAGSASATYTTVTNLTAAESELPTGNATAGRADIPGSSAQRVDAAGGTKWSLPVSDVRSLVVTGTAS
jgi:hypothetical protein